MKNKLFFLSVFLFLATCFVFYFNNNYVIRKANIAAPLNVIKEKYHDVLFIWVVDSNEFDLKLKDPIRGEKRVLVKLPLRNSKDAKEYIISFLNECENPKVHLISWKEDRWVAEIILKHNGKDVKLSSWLKEQGLAFYEHE